MNYAKSETKRDLDRENNESVVCVCVCVGPWGGGGRGGVSKEVQSITAR